MFFYPSSAMSLRLRIQQAKQEPIDVEAASEAELARVLLQVSSGHTTVSTSSPAWSFYLNHDGRWWNLSANLWEYCLCKVEAGTATTEEVRPFVERPFLRPDWLFDAAQQMARLLQVSDLSPREVLVQA